MQRRRLQAVPGALCGHAVPRDPVQLAVHERNELLERGGIAIRPGPEQRRDIWRSHRRDGILPHGATHTLARFLLSRHRLRPAYRPCTSIVVGVRHFNRHCIDRTATAHGWYHGPDSERASLSK